MRILAVVSGSAKIPDFPRRAPTMMLPCSRMLLASLITMGKFTPPELFHRFSRAWLFVFSILLRTRSTLSADEM